MTKVLGTGLTGLVGSGITKLLPYEFEQIGRETGVDIQNKDAVLHAVSSSDATVLLHLAAKTHVDLCEEDKEKGEQGEAWQVNVLGTQNIVEACKSSGKKIIYVSTDFVFDGNPPFEGYDEEYPPHPINWYGYTKFEGEKIVSQAGIPFLIARIAYPYCSDGAKKDFFRTILEKLKQKEEILVVSDHIIMPTFIDDIAKALRELIDTDKTGIYHVVGSKSISPYDAALLIARMFNLDSNLVKKTTRAEYFKNKAPRPFNLTLKNDKIRRLGADMKTFEEGLIAIKNQINMSS